jgi:hypothetical protein
VFAEACGESEGAVRLAALIRDQRRRVGRWSCGFLFRSLFGRRWRGFFAAGYEAEADGCESCEEDWLAGFDCAVVAAGYSHGILPWFRVRVAVQLNVKKAWARASYFCDVAYRSFDLFRQTSGRTILHLLRTEQSLEARVCVVCSRYSLQLQS